jgi:hypothetical protein
MIGIKVKGIARLSMIMAPTRGFLSATNLAIKRGPPMSSPPAADAQKASPISAHVKP